MKTQLIPKLTADGKLEIPGKHPNASKNTGRLKSRLHKQSLPPQALKISLGRRTKVCIAPDF